MLPEFDFTPIWALVGTNIIAIFSAIFWLPKRFFEHKFAKRMAEIEQKHDVLIKRYDHYASFSQPTFERLFQKKIDAYQDFLKLKVEMYEILEKNENADDSERANHAISSLMLRSIRILQPTQLYVSSMLAQKYDDWFEEASKIIACASSVKHEFLAESYVTPDDVSHASFAEEHELQELATKTLGEFLEIFEQVDKDVKGIRNILEGSLAENYQTKRP